MPRRHPKPGAQQVAPQGFPGDGGRRGRAPLLPRLTPAELRAAPGAQGSRGSRMSAGGSGWWPDSGSGSEWSHPELGAGSRAPQPHLPALPTPAQRAARTRRALQSLLLPPLPAPRAPPDPEPREDPRGDPAREGPDFLGALLGELLPGRFRQFLRQLRALCEEPPPSPSEPRAGRAGGLGPTLGTPNAPGGAPGPGPAERGPWTPCAWGAGGVPAPVARVRPLSPKAAPAETPGRTLPSQDSFPSPPAPAPAASASQHPREASELPAPGPRSCGRSLHADLLGQSCCLQKDLQKALLHHMPALGPLRGAQPQCNTVKECSQFHSTQAPKLKAVISHSSSGEGSGSHRRYCPFRVRFADETLRDTAIRYWDRYCTEFIY